jgi:hypothetical protein
LKALVGLSAVLLLAACGPSAPAPTEPASAPVEVAPPAPATPVEYPLVDPIEPGRPGGLPDDRTPISEAPYTAKSPQGAANQMQIYFALIGEKKFDQAWELWNSAPTDGPNGTGFTKDQFIADMNRYYQYSGQVGAPGLTEGAAGSIFITVPVQIYGRLKSGETFHQRGDATLRRVNDVDRATERQLHWRISGIETTSFPG